MVTVGALVYPLPALVTLYETIFKSNVAVPPVPLFRAVVVKRIFGTDVQLRPAVTCIPVTVPALLTVAAIFDPLHPELPITRKMSLAA
jgi:hypothetical protein